MEKRRTKRVGFLRSIIGRGLARTLFLSFLGISLIPLSVVGWLGFQSASDAIEQNKSDQLTAISQLKKANILAYFSEQEANLKLEAESQKNREFIQRLQAELQESKLTADKFVKDLRWVLLADAYASEFTGSLLRYGFLNLLFIDNEGNLLYAVEQYSDLGTNLFNGRFAQTKFTYAIQQALATEEVVFSDLEFYTPLGGQIAGFLCHVIYNEAQEKIGIIAAQISIEPINQVLQDNTGLGETGETYLVGPDLLMRSNLRFLTDNPILKNKIDTPVTQQWLEALVEGDQLVSDSVSLYTGYRGKSVLGAYQSVEVGGVSMALIAELEEEEAFRPVDLLSKVVGVSLAVTSGMIVLIALYITGRIVTPVRALTAWAGQIAEGKLVIEKIRVPSNEIGDLNHSIQELVESFRTVTEVCEAVSVGDYSRSIALRSDHDVLARSINQMAQMLLAVVKQANIIAEGDYSLEIHPRSEKDQLAVALAHMTERLRTISAENERQHWFKTGQAELSERLRGEQSLHELGFNILSFLADYIDANIGAIYHTDEASMLSMVASYAYSFSNDMSKQFNLGEGLIGQVAQKKQRILLHEIPENYLSIESGMLKGKPKQIVLLPLVNGEVVAGVIELGTLNQFTDDQLNFLDSMAESIAIALLSAQARLRLADMLNQTQQQAETLEKQKAALRIANEELERKTEELVLASQYKSDFLARMSHELRTPLNSILLLSNNLLQNKSGNLTKKQTDHAKVIHSAGSDLLSLINDILDISKVEAGRLDIIAEQVDVVDVIEGVERSFSYLAEDKGIDFIVKVDPKVPAMMLTDRQRVEQVLRNLISNAFKFTKKGGVTLKVCLVDYALPSLAEKTGIKVIAFIVSDTGCGIPVDKQEQIFEAFRQGDGGTSRKYGGTGLGLNISKELALALQGELALVISEEGKGSQFVLYLPEELPNTDDNSVILAELTIPHTSPESIVATDHATSTNLTKSYSSKNILIVDDDMRNIYSLSALLEEHDIRVTIATSGEGSLKKLSQIDVCDLIFMDIMMPGMNGYEVIDAIRRKDKFINTPIIAVSANTLVEEHDKCLAAGANDYIAKPIDIDKLSVLLEKWLK